jgi:hypothetical protein
MNVKMLVVGNKRLAKRLTEIRTRAPDAYAAAIYLAGTNILSTSLKLAPVATGHLRKTRYLTRPRMSGPRFDMEIGYSASYAVFVHEIRKNYFVGEWKFLKRAVDYHAPRLMDDIARWAIKFMANGVPPFMAHHPTTPFIGPEPRRLGAYAPKKKGAIETKRAKKARFARNAKRNAKREIGRQNNSARILAEAQKSAESIAAGRRPPRPGRG